MKGFLVLSQLLFLGFCYSQGNAEFQRLYINEKKYSILFPSDWRLKHTDSLQNYFTLLSPKTSSDDTLTEVVNLKIDHIGRTTFRKTIKVLEPILIKKFGEPIFKNEIFNNNLKGREYIFVEDKSSLIYKYQVYFKNEDLYMLFFLGSKSEYSQFEEIVTKIFETFEIK